VLLPPPGDEDILLFLTKAGSFCENKRESGQNNEWGAAAAGAKERSKEDVL